MSTFNHAASRRLTPRKTPAKPGREETSLRFSLTRIIGTTAVSASAFDYLSDLDIVATCAGSAAVLSRFDADLNVTQRIFRAGPNATAINASSPFYDPGTPPSFRDSTARQSIARDAGAANYSDLMIDSPGRSKAHTRTRNASCLSLSPDGRLLAVGENGYNPRINIFSIADNASLDIPLSTLTEHSNFGIRSVAFSPDSRWLCSLGNINDGFIFLWSISKNGSARLHSSNKCISSVQEVAWMGSSVISVGTRHVKVWRLEHAEPISPTKGRADMIKGSELPPSSPVPKALSGRNCLLGSLINAVFTTVVAVSKEKAILCTESGDICILDDSDQNQRIVKVARVKFRVFCLCIDQCRNSVIVAGSEGNIKIFSVQELERSEKSTDYPEASSRPGSGSDQIQKSLPDVLAVGCLSKGLITIDAGHIMCLRTVEALKNDEPTTMLQQVSAHAGAILGVSALQRPNKRAADFFTWSSLGTVLFWTLDGTCTYRLEIPLDQGAPSGDNDVNELKVMRASSTTDLLVFGDKHGNIGLASKPDQTVKAHNGEINDVAVAHRENSSTLIASCGRDRNLQLFQLENGALNLLQTMENEHAASVNSLLFLDNGASLISASADRTIVIRTLASVKDQTAAYATKVLTLKSSPVAFTPMPSEPETLIVSTMDRQILHFNMKSGRLIQSYKATDVTCRESVTISSMVAEVVNNKDSQIPAIFGASSTDRSVRAYDSATGALLARDYGQLVISDIAFVRSATEHDADAAYIVTTGLDYTIMIWGLSAASHPHTSSDGTINHHDIPQESNKPSQPLRRVLSKSDVSGLQRSLGQDPSTPTRNHHPSRIRKKASALTLGRTPKPAAPSTAKKSRSAHHSPSASAQGPGQESPHDPSPTLTTRKVTLASRAKRSSSDGGRHQPISATCADDIVSSTKDLCKSLRTFRKRLEDSTEELPYDLNEGLKQELAVTMHSLSQKTQELQQAGKDMTADDLADSWLARLIDERLSLRFGDKPMEESKTQDSQP